MIFSKKIKELKESRKQDYDDEAHENLMEVENQEWIDSLEEVDELLLFESALNNLEGINKDLFDKIKTAVKEERFKNAKTVFERVRKDKDEKK